MIRTPRRHPALDDDEPLHEKQERRIAALEQELWRAINAMALEVIRCQSEGRSHSVLTLASHRAIKVFNG